MRKRVTIEGLRIVEVTHLRDALESLASSDSDGDGDDTARARYARHDSGAIQRMRAYADTVRTQVERPASVGRSCRAQRAEVSSLVS